MLAVFAGTLGVRAFRRGHVAITTACSSAHADATKVLFIGNSHTFVNDLPRTLCSVSESAHAITVKSVTMPGWSLSQHWADGTARKAIESETWDWVVLQEQSTLPLDGFEAYEDSVRAFDAVIKRSGARTMIYELWPRRDLRQDPARLEAAYVRAAGDVHASVARVGPAWLSAQAVHPELVLYREDGYHPAPPGTYIGACVFHAAFFHESPVGRPFHDLDAPMAADLQRIAWDAQR